ncbi:MAG: glycosyltransferase family 2 protein [Deltaproteobacteria bacterium]|nr:glycosyltransferase family 2 protein [Deltaproteobacteria bacterium]
MNALKSVFWFSGFLVVYPYLGYLAVLWVCSQFAGGRQRDAGTGKTFEPKITLIVSAHNEEKVIEAKIINSIALDYPKSKLEIMVVSDGSTDLTDEIVKRYAANGVILRRFEGRLGKTACLNRAVPMAVGEIIIFSDANSTYDPAAARKLTAHFDDEKCGFVTGGTRYAGNGAISEAVGFYSRIEKMTKTLESRTGSCVGADGAIFAIRKKLFKRLKDSDINDLVIPLGVVRQGCSGVLEPDAFCVEDTAGNAKGEFNRQMRITARTLRAIFSNADLLNPVRFGFFSFKILSHKILRLMAPFFMLALLISSAFLTPESWFYAAVFAGQLLFYSLALIGRAMPDETGLLSVPYAFSSVNAAILMGWVKYFKGETFVTWAPTKR